MNLICRHCKLPWPGDEVIASVIRRELPELPTCIKAPPRARWFVDSGINGHVFVEGRVLEEVATDGDDYDYDEEGNVWP